MVPWLRLGLSFWRLSPATKNDGQKNVVPNERGTGLWGIKRKKNVLKVHGQGELAQISLKRIPPEKIEWRGECRLTGELG
jgi:hypothetical protein